MSDAQSLREINTNVNNLSNTMASFLSAQTVMNESQKAINESTQKTMDKIGDAMARSEAMQVELNGHTQRMTEMSHKQTVTDDKVVNLSEQVTINKILVDQTQDLKKIFAKSMVGVFFMFLVSVGASVYSTNAKQEASAESSDQLQTVLAELLAKKE